MALPAIRRERTEITQPGRRAGPRSRLRRWFGLNRLIGLGLLALLLVVYAGEPQPVETLRLKVFDLMQSIRPREVTVRPVTIVDIDEPSLARFGQWPWPRTLLAELVDKVFALGAAVVAFDVVFPESDRLNPAAVAVGLPGLDAETRRSLLALPSNDEILAGAIESRPVVLGRVGFAEQRSVVNEVPLSSPILVKKTIDAPPVAAVVVQAPTLIRNIPVIEAAGAGHGLVSLLPEADGIVRRVPAVYLHGEALFPGLAMEILRIAFQRRTLIAEMDAAGLKELRIARGVTVPTDGGGRVWPYFSRRDRAKYVSFAEVIDGTADPALFAGKLVIVGTSAFGLHDIRATPVERATPGVEVHAQVIENALTDGFLHRPNTMIAAELLLILTGGLLMIWLVPWIGAKGSLVLFAIVAGSATAAAWWLFTEAHILFDVAYPIIAMLLLYTFLTYMGYASEEAGKRRVREAFGFYLAPAMVEKLADDPSQLALGGETRPMSILFCDIRGFTTISEAFKSNPEALTQLINKLLTPLTAVILDRRGTVDKYMGDCIMAFWNAPLNDPCHARHACLAALEMQAVMAPLNDRLAAEAAAEGRSYQPLAIGVGINSGEVVVGNMGSDQRFDYSVLGDAVNLASRLEGQSKAYRVGIIVGENTRALVPDLALLELDRIRVKGKRDAVSIYTVVGDESVRTGNAFPVLKGAHDALLAAYRDRAWAAARGHLATCRGLIDGFDLAGLYDLYEQRLDEYEATPPPGDWDGVYVATSK